MSDENTDALFPIPHGEQFTMPARKRVFKKVTFGTYNSEQWPSGTPDADPSAALKDAVIEAAKAYSAANHLLDESLDDDAVEAGEKFADYIQSFQITNKQLLVAVDALAEQEKSLRKWLDETQRDAAERSDRAETTSDSDEWRGISIGLLMVERWFEEADDALAEVENEVSE